MTVALILLAYALSLTLITAFVLAGSYLVTRRRIVLEAPPEPAAAPVVVGEADERSADRIDASKIGENPGR